MLVGLDFSPDLVAKVSNISEIKKKKQSFFGNPHPTLLERCEVSFLPNHLHICIELTIFVTK